MDHDALCKPEPDAIAFIKRGGFPVVEIGAGNGAWLLALRAADVDCLSYDIRPRGPNVIKGNHIDAAQHSDRAMLAVWPPDGKEVQKWIDAAPWPMIYLCGALARLDYTAPDYETIDTIQLAPGQKQGNWMTALKREEAVL